MNLIRKTLVLCVFGTLAQGASATPITFSVEGTFDDGATFAGTFVFDDEAMDLFGGLLSVAITTTDGLFAGTSYERYSSASGLIFPATPPGRIALTAIGLDDAPILGFRDPLFLLAFTPAIWSENTTAIVRSLGDPIVASFEQNGELVRTVTSGTIIAVPEPGTLGLFGIGVVALALRRGWRKRTVAQCS